MTLYSFPKKRFGQNFLVNNHFAVKIIDSLNLCETDTILEIGPGRGILTQHILRLNCKRKIVIEIDKQISDQLIKIYGNKIEIFNQDFLTFSFKDSFTNTKPKIKIVGNIPYNITSPILFHLLDNSIYISEAVLMVQKEVAERLVASINTKEYGILSVLLNVQSNVKKLFFVGRNNFHPQPKVDSAVIKIVFQKSYSEINNYELFKSIVRGTFNHRRKMLKNTLKAFVPSNEIHQIKSVSLDLRPENLSTEDFIDLTNEIASIKKN